MPACGPRRGSMSGPVRPSSPAKTQDPREGPSLVRRTTPRPPRGAASPGWLSRSGDINARCTSRGSYDVSHDDHGQAGASGRSVPVSSLVLRRQAQARSTEASTIGFLIGATRPKPAGRQDGGHHGAQDGVTTRAFGRRRPPLVRITCTSCLPSNFSVVASLPTSIWEEDPGHYK